MDHDVTAQIDAPTPGADHSAATSWQRPTGARPFWVAMAIGAISIALLAAGVLGEAAADLFVVLGLGAAVSALVGLKRYRPNARSSWVMLAASMTLFLIGGGLRSIFGTLGDLSSHRSLIPDAVTIPGYLLLAFGLLGVAAARGGKGLRDLDGLLDGIVASLAALTLAWIYLVNPALFAQAPLTTRLFLSAYPPLSVFLLAVAVRWAFGKGNRPVSLWFMLAALGSMLVGDVLYMLAETGAAAGVPLNLLEIPYAVAFVCFIGMVLHPSMPQLAEPQHVPDAVPTRGRLALVAIALGIPGIVTVTRVDAATGDRIALAAIVLSLTTAATWRMFRALRAHAQSEARLAYQATHDALTGLPNRSYLHEHVNHEIGRMRTEPGLLALLFLDVDRFKLVNDSHGHSLGDEFLLAVSRRLRTNVRPNDLVARIGGDEFVIVAHGLHSVEQALEIAERTRLAFDVPFVVRGAEIATSVSIGVAVTDGSVDGVDAESMIRDADTAMYQAKEAGRDAVTVFDQSMRDHVAQRVLLERDLRHALDREQLHLHYQPLVSLPGERVEGFEALLRWAHPTWGAVPPLSFVPVAEDTGLIVPIGAWVIREACRQVARWRRELPDGERLYVSVNLSVRQLRDPELVSCVADALAVNGLPGDALCLEITESLLMDNPGAAAELLATLRALDVRLSVDDFGTGYSSLSYLRRFPVDHVKIDRSFVDDLGREDTSEESLVAAIVAMAGALRIGTVAEGVETVEQARRLAALGCDVAQGYLYARPLAPDAVPEAVARLGVQGTAPHLALVPEVRGIDAAG